MNRKCLYAGAKEEIRLLYYGNIRKNPLAALVKCIDRCNNLSCMADGFDRPKMRKYILETEKYILPLLDVIRDIPAYNNAAWNVIVIWECELKRNQRGATLLSLENQLRRIDFFMPK